MCIYQKQSYILTSRDTPCLPQDHDINSHFKTVKPKIVRIQIFHTGFLQFRTKLYFPQLLLTPLWNSLNTPPLPFVEYTPEKSHL